MLLSLVVNSNVDLTDCRKYSFTLCDRGGGKSISERFKAFNLQAGKTETLAPAHSFKWKEWGPVLLYTIIIASFTRIPSNLLLNQRGRNATKPGHAFCVGGSSSVVSKMVYLWHPRLNHRVWNLALLDHISASLVLISHVHGVCEYKGSRMHLKQASDPTVRSL